MSARTRLAVPEPMQQPVADAVAAYVAARRAELQREMNSVHTDHRRRDVLAGALSELDHLEGPPAAEPDKPTKPVPPRRSLY